MENIERFFTTQNEHWNEHTFKIFTDAKKEGIFEDLEVPLKYFEDYSGIYQSNREAPLRVTEQLRAAMEEDGLEERQQQFIMESLIDWFEKTVFDGKDNEKYRMDKVVKILEMELPTAKNEGTVLVSVFDFEKMKKELEAMPDTAEKIKCLVEKETLYNQQKDPWDTGFGPDFGKKCRMEIKKLEKFLEMEAVQKMDTEPLDSPKNREFTTARQVLAMHYIFKHLQVRGDIEKAQKARFIEFLTGKNYKNIYDMVGNPLATKNKDFRKADLQYIRTFFENLGLSEIAKSIGNELDTPE